MVKKRLNEKGEDSEGKKIKTFGAVRNNAYAFATIQIRESMGKQTDHVDLNFTGQAHKTMVTEIANKIFHIEMDTDKEDGKIEDNVDLTNVLNLSTEEKTKLVNEIRGKFIQETRKTIGL